MGVMDVGYRRAVRPVLFRLGRGDAETAHHSTLTTLGWAARHAAVLAVLRRMFAAHSAPREVFGLHFPAPVGLAAGADKDGLALKAWPALGFGFVEAGTVTAVPQPGNDRPRVFRLRGSEAVINRMGFPNAGAEALAVRCAETGPIGVPLGISLGKSKSAPVSEAVADYLTSLRAVEAHADYLAVNVSSPNTPGLRGLQDRGALDELVAALVTEAAGLATARGSRPAPVLVKIAPDLTDDAISDVLQVCHDRGAAGVIATNTTLGRGGIAPRDRGLAFETGGLSGLPLADRALQVVRFVTAHTDLPVMGVGGIGSVDAARAMFDAGAALVQIYTGLLYRGPGLVKGITKAAGAR